MLTVLALILGAWAQGLAQSRPHAAELIAVEICAEGGSYEILLDSRGRPVNPDDCAQSLCPDCIPALSLAAADRDQSAVTRSLIPLVVMPGAQPVPVGRPYSVPFGRGPPELA